MNVSFSSRHVDISDDSKEYTMQKVEKLGRIYDRITDVKAIISKENKAFLAEFVINVPNYHTIVVKKDSEKLYSAIDSAINICERELQEYKGKKRDRKGRLHDVPEDSISREDTDTDDYDNEQY